MTAHELYASEYYHPPWFIWESHGVRVGVLQFTANCYYTQFNAVLSLRSDALSDYDEDGSDQKVYASAFLCPVIVSFAPVVGTIFSFNAFRFLACGWHLMSALNVKRTAQ